jgi:putative ABC transport system permease protein
MFQVKWTAPSPVVLVGGWAIVSALTVLTGWLSNRGICDHPPLAVLREET